MKKIYILISVCLFSISNAECQESVTKETTLEQALAHKNIYTARKDKKTGEYRNSCKGKITALQSMLSTIDYIRNTENTR